MYGQLIKPIPCYNLSPLITGCSQPPHTHRTKNKKKRGPAVMKRKSAAFRCHRADVCWQALPSPVQENTEKSALPSCLSQPWRTAGADWQHLEQCLGSAAKTRTTATRRFLWASGGSSHPSRPRWVTSLPAPDALCVYMYVHTHVLLLDCPDSFMSPY